METAWWPSFFVEVIAISRRSFTESYSHFTEHISWSAAKLGLVRTIVSYEKKMTAQRHLQLNIEIKEKTSTSIQKSPLELNSRARNLVQTSNGHFFKYWRNFKGRLRIPDFMACTQTQVKEEPQKVQQLFGNLEKHLRIKECMLSKKRRSFRKTPSIRLTSQTMEIL